MKSFTFYAKYFKRTFQLKYSPYISIVSRFFTQIQSFLRTCDLKYILLNSYLSRIIHHSESCSLFDLISNLYIKTCCFLTGVVHFLQSIVSSHTHYNFFKFLLSCYLCFTSIFVLKFRSRRIRSVFCVFHRISDFLESPFVPGSPVYR